ncbi:iron-containing redox enzyme family protein [soil metagenome]
MSFYRQLEHDTAQARATLLASPVIGAAMSGQVGTRHYLDFLTRAYHHVRHTVPLLMACGSRLPGHKEWLRNDVAHYVEEEIGHHEWILNDVTAAGGSAQAVRDSQPDADTELMVAYAYDTVTRRNPVSMFGMVYVLEGTSVSLATQAASALREGLGLGAGAFSYLSSHGSLDQAHIGDFERLVNKLDEEADRQAIVHSASMFYRLYGNVLRGIDLAEAA